MLHDYRAVREIANAIAEESEQVISAYRRARITDEPHITDRLMGAIEARVRNMSHGPAISTGYGGGILAPIRWEVMTLRSGPGSAAHEKKFGADILGVFNAELPNYKISKGFLAQAKRAEPGEFFARAEWNRMIEQCNRMLNLTPDAFIIAYSKKKGVRFFSALAVTSLNSRDMFDLYSMAPRAFFERHFQSFIGDKRLNRPDISVLERLQVEEAGDERPSCHVINFVARQG